MAKKSKVETARNQIVAQSNAFIRHARTNLTAREQDIVYFLFSRVRSTDRDFMTVKFTVAEFCELCGLKNIGGRDYAEIKRTLKSLADKSAWVEYVDEAGGGRIGKLIRWVDTYEINYKSGDLQATLSQSIKAHLLGLIETGHFMQAALVNFLAMRSQYSKRLYELIKSHLIAKSRETETRKEFEIVGLKKLLGAEKYNRYADFKRRVLDPAMREINAVTDIEANYETRKWLGVTSYVTFHFKLKDLLGQKKARMAADMVLDGRASEQTDPDGTEANADAAALASVSYDDLFRPIWQKVRNGYKKGMKDAKAAFVNALKNGVPPDFISRKLDDYYAYADRMGYKGRYIKNGGSWFVGEHWNDELDISQQIVQPPKTSFHDYKQGTYDWNAMEKKERAYLDAKYGLSDKHKDDLA